MRVTQHLGAAGALLLLASLAQAAPGDGGGHVVHEKRSSGHPAWKRHAPAPAEYVLPIKIGLRQQNLEHVDRFLDDVAHPRSPNFGKHWTPGRVADVFAPARETVDATVAWLVGSGIGNDRIKVSKGKNWIEFDATVREAEHLLDTQYHLFSHPEAGMRVACDQYAVPRTVQPHIDFILPTIQLDSTAPRRPSTTTKRDRIGQPHDLARLHARGLARHEAADALNLTNINGTGLAICSTLITVNCLRALYSVPAPSAGQRAQAGNVLGIAEWADYLYLPDLAAFFRNWTSPPVPASVVPEFVSIDGGRRSNLTLARLGNVVESALDFQVAYSLIHPQGARLYQVGDSVNVDSVGTFNIFLDALDASYCDYEGGDQPYVDPEYPDPNLGGFTGPHQCGGAPVSNVISVSYGQIEGALPVFYQQRQCYEWAKLALQGVSVIFASGDSGVANRYNAGYNNSCLNEEHGYVDTYGTKFSPSFPATCPYITSVGGTQLRNGSVSGGEVAAFFAGPANALQDYSSGGGFSNVFARPSWQSGAVGGYLRSHDPGYAEGVFNRSGRAYPDVAAMGLNVTTVYLDGVYGVGGTSAAAPIFAALVNMLNEERLAAGKRPVGFLNPVLYAHADMFHDVTLGSNPGCGTAGFSAAKGWDPVTGLGTPNYARMRDVFMGLP